MLHFDPDRIKYLLDAYSGNRSSEEEKRELMKWIDDAGDKDILEEYIRHLCENEDLVPGFAPVDSEIMLDRIRSISAEVHQPAPYRTHFMKRWGWAAAASVAVLLVSAVYYYSHRVNTVNVPSVASANLPADVKPGHNGAVLTLGNGHQIVLDSLHNGVIAVQSGARIVLDNDRVAYRSADVEKVTYNTMTTPRGRQYSLVLEDGTKVWLNAASSITYPTAFRGNDRKVQMTGEAYFEVAKDPKRPFRVEVNYTVVEVLGTHFNINAYADESSVRTTLLEGSVRLEKGKLHSTIVPGQQAEISNATDKIAILNDVDLEAAVAWKNGYFSFQNAGLRQIMREISRWYDVEVVYQSADPGITFSGDLGRNLTLSQVLSALHEMNIHYKIEANKLIIKP